MRRDGWSAVLALGWLLAGLLVVYPLGAVLLASVRDGAGGPTLAHWRAVALDPGCRAAIARSLGVALAASLGAVLLGLPLALCVARWRVPGRRALTVGALLTLVSPPFVGAYAWILLLGQQGLLRGALRAIGLEPPPIYGPGGVILVLALQHYPYVFLLASAGLSAVDRSLEEAAESLGATPWRRLLRVTLPLVAPSLAAGGLLAFTGALANFGTPMVLASDWPLLPTLTYDLYTSEVARDPGRAAALGLVLVLLAAAGLGLERRVAGRRRVHGSLLRRAALRPLEGARRVWVPLLAWGIVGLGALPLLTVVGCSFRATRGPVFQPGLALTSYRTVLREAPRALENSLLYALAAALLIAALGALLGYLLARRPSAPARALDATLMVPYVLPGTVLGIGFLLAFHRLGLTGTGAVLILAGLVRRLPSAVRGSQAILLQVDPALEDAARSLGAAPGRAFLRVTLPLMTPGVLAGALLGWVSVVNELSAALLLYTGRTITAPVLIYQAVLDGAYGPAAALSTLLLVATGATLYAALQLTDREAAESSALG